MLSPTKFLNLALPARTLSAWGSCLWIATQRQDHTFHMSGLRSIKLSHQNGLGMRPDETFHLDPDTLIHNFLDQSDTYFFCRMKSWSQLYSLHTMNSISNHICSWAAMWEERELGPVVPRNGTNNTTMETTRGCDSVTKIRHCHSCWKCTFHHIIYVYILKIYVWFCKS